MRCALCKTAALQRVYSDLQKNGQSYSVFLCPECRLAVTGPFPDDAHLGALYSSSSYRTHGRRFIYPVEWLIRRFRMSRLRRVERLSPKGSILDIGCGSGLFLALARENGWQTSGIEFNAETASFAGEVLGLDVRTGNLRDAGFKDGTFDVVTFWHVLEHLPEPVETLRECLRVLKPGGLVVVSLPNLDSLQSRLSGRHWFHLDVPYHLYHFSEKSLLKLLNSLSLRVVRVRHFSCEFNPFGFIHSILNMAGIRHNLLYDILKVKELRPEKPALKYYGSFLGIILLSPLVFTLSLIGSLIESMLGRGGSIEVCARKEGT